jgi:hypothetical protein
VAGKTSIVVAQWEVKFSVPKHLFLNNNFEIFAVGWKFHMTMSLFSSAPYQNFTRWTVGFSRMNYIYGQDNDGYVKCIFSEMGPFQNHDSHPDSQL